MKQQRSMKDLWKDSYLSGGNDAYLEELYETYLKKPDDVTPEWQNYFNQLAASNKDVSHADIRDYFSQLAKQTSTKRILAQPSTGHHEYKQEKVVDLITAYRSFGHLQANIDPLGLYHGIHNPTLDLSYYGFSATDMETVFDVDTFAGLKKIVCDIT